MHRSLALAVLVAGLLCSTTRVSFAKDLKYRKMSFAERGSNLVVSTTFTELFDADAFRNLSSGFPTTVVMRLYVYRKKGQRVPVAIRVLSFQIVYDLWDEVYLLRLEGPLGTKNLRVESRVDVLQTVTELRRFPVADLAGISIGPHHFLAVVVELNPIEEEMLAEMRRWLTKSSSETRLDSSSSFFGSFVSVFVNPKLQAAERVLRLRSQPFYRVAQ